MKRHRAIRLDELQPKMAELNIPAMVKEYYAITYGEPEWDTLDEYSPIGSVGEGSLGLFIDIFGPRP